jgi:crotonobetainyl-CoA:carnitine CoA-transferase CaiB-like acyl-CoA transferase
MKADQHSAGGSATLSSFLKGLRVLDLSQYIPGPMATLFLADMGAQVFKIEPPKGDEMRNLGPRDARGRPTYYRALNAGKTVCRMNLKDPTDHAAFLDMVRTADIVVEGFRPGVMARLGIDWPVLNKINPRLILCSISGYGAGSSNASRAGHDANYLAEMGVAHRNGAAAPAFYDPPLADSAGSLFAAMLLLGALHGRNRTGQGCMIDLALADTVMPLQMMQIADFGASGTVQGRGEYYLNGAAAYYQVYAIAGGDHAVLGAVEPKFWATFCTEAGRPDLIERQGDPMPQTDLRAEVAAILAPLTADEVERRFGPLDCCLSVIRDLGEAVNSAQVAERQLVRTDAGGEIQSLLPVWIDGVPPPLRPPLCEERTRPSVSPVSERTETKEKLT